MLNGVFRLTHEIELKTLEHNRTSIALIIFTYINKKINKDLSKLACIDKTICIIFLITDASVADNITQTYLCRINLNSMKKNQNETNNLVMMRYIFFFHFNVNGLHLFY